MKKYTINEDYFDVIDNQDKAYWLGFIAADGYNREDRGYIEFRLHKQDIDILNKFKQCLSSNHNIQIYKDTYCNLTIYSSKLSKKLAEYGIIINKYRDEFINKIKEKITEIHKNVTKEKEEIKIKYISDSFSKDVFLRKLKENRLQDIERGYTTVGIQKDDIYFFINGKRVDIFGSQGQQRTTILSLKICELEIIKEEIGESPILLLDDFMSELDEKRRSHFFNKIENTQVIITCTDKIDIENKNILRYNVKEGKINR